MERSKILLDRIAAVMNIKEYDVDQMGVQVLHETVAKYTGANKLLTSCNLCKMMNDTLWFLDPLGFDEEQAITTDHFHYVVDYLYDQYRLNHPVKKV
jgi:hypothetical protein